MAHLKIGAIGQDSIPVDTQNNGIFAYESLTRMLNREISLRKDNYTCLFRRNGTECNRHNVIERKGNFRSVRLGATVGHFLENCSYPFRLKVDFQAVNDRFRSVEKGKKSAARPAILLFLY
uniref:Uncharacterized protein n=1 Tax=Romanomermis culicivorax TaxID=13658 RepID=A0A915HER8_ROMCU